MVIRTSPNLQKPFRNVPFGMRPILLEGDTGAPGGSGSGAAGAGAGSGTQGGGAGSGTGAGAGAGTGTAAGAGAGSGGDNSGQQSQGGAQGQQNSEAKFTQADVDAAKAKWQADQDAAVAEAERKAKEEADIENGKAKEIAQARLTEIQDLKAKIARMEAPLTAKIEADTKDWPASIVAKKPTEGGYEALLTWFESYKEVAQEYLTNQANSASQAHGNGFQPNPQQNGANNQSPVASLLQSKYAPKKAG